MRPSSTGSQREAGVKGLRFERIGNGRHYNVVCHISSTDVPVSDDTLAELKAHNRRPPERFLELLVEKVRYASYRDEQHRPEVKTSSDPTSQVNALQDHIPD